MTGQRAALFFLSRKGVKIILLALWPRRKPPWRWFQVSEATEVAILTEGKVGRPNHYHQFPTREALALHYRSFLPHKALLPISARGKHGTRASALIGLIPSPWCWRWGGLRGVRGGFGYSPAICVQVWGVRKFWICLPSSFWRSKVDRQVWEIWRERLNSSLFSHSARGDLRGSVEGRDGRAFDDLALPSVGAFNEYFWFCYLYVLNRKLLSLVFSQM